MVQQPTITIEGMRRHLSADGLPLDRHYIASLVKAIQAERIKRSETWTLNIALASFQDAMAEIARVGWEIANDQMAPGRDRAAALQEVREAYNTAFQGFFDAGVFERKLGTLDAMIRNTPLPDDKKRAIAATFANWGLIVPADEPKALTSQNPAENPAPRRMPPTLPDSSVNPFETFEARKESRKHLLGFSLIYLTGYFTDSLD